MKGHLLNKNLMVEFRTKQTEYYGNTIGKEDSENIYKYGVYYNRVFRKKLSIFSISWRMLLYQFWSIFDNLELWNATKMARILQRLNSFKMYYLRNPSSLLKTRFIRPRCLLRSVILLLLLLLLRLSLLLLPFHLTQFIPKHVL